MTSVWVIGARGLLGGALKHRLDLLPSWTVVPTEPLPWAGNGDDFDEVVLMNLRSLLESAADDQTDWTVAWCAGVAVTGSAPDQLDREIGQLDRMLELLTLALSEYGSPSGAVFFASSAGGVFAGASDPPFTERTVARPLSPYGEGKLRAESLVRAFGEQTGQAVLVGRIANLYGPGQSINKSQGLITQLAKANLSPRPASIYVPLETTRDYIFVDDCASLIADCLRRILTSEERIVVKILASHQAVTIGTLLGQFTALNKSRPHVMLGASKTAGYQAIDLRLRSVVWTDLDRRDLMPLPAGIQITARALVDALQAGELSL